MKSTLTKCLYHHLLELARERDPYMASGGHFLIQQYIRQQLAQWGEVENHEFEVEGKTHTNLILNLAGSSKKELPPILLGAHYDAVPGTPGADDNASGVAVLLELAQAFAVKPAKYPLRLVAFDLEECYPHGCLRGSSEYAAYLRQQNQPLRLMLSLEMLGYCDRTANSQRYPAGLKRFYPHRGDFIALVGNLTTIPDLIRLSRIINRSGTSCQWLPVPNRGLSIPLTRSSDHSPFWDRGYPALMVTDTAYLRNPHYHKPSDRIETLDLEFLTGVCQGLVVAISSL